MKYPAFEQLLSPARIGRFARAMNHVNTKNIALVLIEKSLTFVPLSNQKVSMQDQNPIPQPNNPLHGVKLANIVEELVENYGWEHLAFKVNINCFKHDPSVKSSLVFLRRTPWAREKVEQLYLHHLKKRK
jgi:hypothetical protein